MFNTSFFLSFNSCSIFDLIEDLNNELINLSFFNEDAENKIFSFIYLPNSFPKYILKLLIKRHLVE